MNNRNHKMMFKNGEMQAIEIAPDFVSFSKGKKVEFKDSKRGYALSLKYTGDPEAAEGKVGKYNLEIDDVRFQDLEKAPEQE